MFIIYLFIYFRVRCVGTLLVGGDVNILLSSGGNGVNVPLTFKPSSPIYGCKYGRT